MASILIKTKKAKCNTGNLIFRKKCSFPSGTLLSLSSYVGIGYNSAEPLTDKYRLFGAKSKQTISSLAPSRE